MLNIQWRSLEPYGLNIRVIYIHHNNTVYCSAGTWMGQMCVCTCAVVCLFLSPYTVYSQKTATFFCTAWCLNQESPYYYLEKYKSALEVSFQLGNSIWKCQSQLSIDVGVCFFTWTWLHLDKWIHTVVFQQIIQQHFLNYNPKSEKVGTVWKTQIKKESSDF